MMRIYVVEGHCGEYSDHRNWPVKAFRDEETAKTFMLACIEEGRRLVAAGQDLPFLERMEVYKAHKLDDGFDSDLDCWDYTYFWVDLVTDEEDL